jgi:hypothetical protein
MDTRKNMDIGERASYLSELTIKVNRMIPSEFRNWIKTADTKDLEDLLDMKISITKFLEIFEEIQKRKR